jgi:hypothetical protein
MSIALHPDRMTASERLDEAAGILAAGAMRLLARKSSSLSAAFGESSLDFTASQSVHGQATKRRDSCQ